MNSETLRLLRCPKCSGALTSGPDGVVCHDGHSYRIADDGSVDLMVAPPGDALMARTNESFGYEWTTFHHIQPEDELYWNWYFADVPLEELKGRCTLDAGCGKGRFTRFTAQRVGPLIALDSSNAVRAAAQNLAELPNVTVVRADVLNPPVARESFGFVSCLGVLHHLPDPEAGFRVLAGLLEPEGLMLLYLYSRPARWGLRAIGLRSAGLIRRMTVPLPHGMLRLLAAPLSALLYITVVAPGAIGERYGNRMLASLPLSAYRRKPLRALWLDTFDRLSAPVEHRYTWPELAPWFAGTGFEVIAAREDAGWFVLLRRPPTSLNTTTTP